MITKIFPILQHRRQASPRGWNQEARDAAGPGQDPREVHYGPGHPLRDPIQRARHRLQELRGPVELRRNRTFPHPKCLGHDQAASCARWSHPEGKISIRPKQVLYQNKSFKLFNQQFTLLNFYYHLIWQTIAQDSHSRHWVLHYNKYFLHWETFFLKLRFKKSSLNKHLQRSTQAYGVLDKYKISKTFFMKTSQDDCAYLDSLSEPTQPIEPPKKGPKPTTPAQAADEEELEEAPPQPLVRENITPDAPENVLKTRRAELDTQEKASAAAKLAEVQADQPVGEFLPVLFSFSWDVWFFDHEVMHTHSFDMV